MDALNRFMTDKGFPDTLKFRLRRFFRNTKDISKEQSYQTLVGSLSPKLKVSIMKALNSASILINTDTHMYIFHPTNMKV